MPKSIYLDYAATTPVDPEVLRAMQPYFSKNFGNASSLYSLGQESKNKILSCRKQLAAFLNCTDDEIIFTGSGTASANLALQGLVEKGDHLIVSAIEHPAVLSTAKHLEKVGAELTIVPVKENGIVDVDQVFKKIKPNTKLVSVMYANNEIGTIQPVQKLGSRIEKLNKDRKQPVYFHTDACQAAGALTLDVKKLHVDLMTINAGKIYGPKGIGVLYVKRNTPVKTMLFGGGQERDLYSGTENVPAIVGMTHAMELAEKNRSKENKRLTKMRDFLIKKIDAKIPNTKLNGDKTERLPNNINISIKDVEGESLVFYLDKKGLQVSVGSACSSLDSEYSHVIQALGKTKEEAASSIRISLGRQTRQIDLNYIIKTLADTVEHLRQTKIGT